MKDENSFQIDREKVTRRIDNYIQNRGEINIYAKAPSEESIVRALYAHQVLDEKYGPCFPISKALFSQPSAYSTSLSILEVNRTLFRTSFQLDKLRIQGLGVIFISADWIAGRYYEQNPEEGFGFLERLANVFIPNKWGKSPKQIYDERFRVKLQRGYEWLQEDRPLEQCDYKNRDAIIGFDCLDKCSKAPSLAMMSTPLDDFVAEQIRRIPKSMTENSNINFKWVNGEKIVDMDCTLNELYF